MFEVGERVVKGAEEAFFFREQWKIIYFIYFIYVSGLAEHCGRASLALVLSQRSLRRRSASALSALKPPPRGRYQPGSPPSGGGRGGDAVRLAHCGDEK
jgi:hypothetical protein